MATLMSAALRRRAALTSSATFFFFPPSPRFGGFVYLFDYFSQEVTPQQRPWPGLAPSSCHLGVGGSPVTGSGGMELYFRNRAVRTALCPAHTDLFPLSS